MNPALFPSLAVLWLLSAALAAGDAERSLLHDARAIHDVCELQLDPLVSDGAGTWLLIQVNPTARSGTGMIGSYEDQKGVERRGLITVMQGSWQVIAVLGRPADVTGGTYSWNKGESPHTRRKQLGAKDYYSPFVRPGGKAVCRYNAHAKGAARFQPIFLIPDGWEKEVVPAWESCKKAPHILARKAPLRREAVVELLNGGNRLLSSMAFRRLLESNAIEPDTLRAALGTPDPNKRAAVTYMVLKAPEGASKTGLLEVIHRRIEACHNAAEARPTAIGAFAGALFHSATISIASPSREILKRLRDRLEVTAPGALEDPVLERIFGILGLSGR